MSQQSASSKLESTWGKFSLKQEAQTTQAKLTEAGIEPAKITLETEDYSQPIRLENTEAIANLKTGAITGAVLGALAGLTISLAMTDFANLGLAALNNFQTIHYFAPIMGAIVGAVGISLILGLSGASIAKDNTDNNSSLRRYSLVVKGTNEEITLAKEIIVRQGGIVEQADRR
ncbi:MAG: hypothetical protein AAGK10_13680 [Cyanobacteria bacterium J06555_3]